MRWTKSWGKRKKNRNIQRQTNIEKTDRQSVDKRTTRVSRHKYIYETFADLSTTTDPLLRPGRVQTQTGEGFL